MQDFIYKKVLKPRDCIYLELLVTHGSQLEAEKKHTLIVMKNGCGKNRPQGKKKG